MRPVLSSYLAEIRSGRKTRGQSLVEFSLVLPFFLILLFGVIEFAFALNGALSVDYATRDAALTAAEAGNQNGADCAVLRVIENSVTTPAERARIVSVKVYKSKVDGTMEGPVNTFTRGGTYVCPDGSGTMAYSRDPASNYPESVRCNILAGCGTSTTVDTIGVQMTYTYTWKTPLSNFLPMTGNGYTVIKSNAMRMEPVL